MSATYKSSLLQVKRIRTKPEEELSIIIIIIIIIIITVLT
jgi:hypothetical protein